MFKPPDKTSISRSARIRQRILILGLFITTSASIAGLMLTWADIIQIHMRDWSHICEQPSDVVVTNITMGVGSLVIAFIFGLILMY